ncbi:sororin [Corythoichthys intestinalis]|uniref:sororin n=1 Tax=Corythoichthys intestinalis TaxID=161448 RepID=UPI0025A574DE|nr:sororin [Corythoichthys intestinalis]XP_061808304.1 sororin-like [Nerophis lumbriciformis]
MKGQTPPSQKKMSDSGQFNDSLQRRRSPRLTSPLVNTANNMAREGSAPVKRFTVRKIMPRKTAPALGHDKENTPRRSEGSQEKKQKVSPPGSTRRGRSSGAKKAVVPSPILPPSTPTTPPSQPEQDPRDAEWSQKVRRSYTRISDKSFSSPDTRETLFGFETLQTPEVGPPVSRLKAPLELSSTGSGLGSFILDAEDSVPDPEIPGVALVKRKRSRRKVQKAIDETELDALSAKMNAEFQEAEQFELFVE